MYLSFLLLSIFGLFPVILYLVANEIEHLFMYLYAVCVFSVKYLW